MRQVSWAPTCGADSSAWPPDVNQGASMNSIGYNPVNELFKLRVYKDTVPELLEQLWPLNSTFRV